MQKILKFINPLNNLIVIFGLFLHYSNINKFDKVTLIILWIATGMIIMKNFITLYNKYK